MSTENKTDQQAPEANNKNISKYFLSLLVFIILLFLALATTYLCIFNEGVSSVHQHWGEFGSLVGGISTFAGTIIAGAGIFFLIKTLSGQQQQIELQQQQINIQQRQTDIQQQQIISQQEMTNHQLIHQQSVFAITEADKKIREVLKDDEQFFYNILKEYDSSTENKIHEIVKKSIKFNELYGSIQAFLLFLLSLDMAPIDIKKKVVLAKIVALSIKKDFIIAVVIFLLAAQEENSYEQSSLIYDLFFKFQIDKVLNFKVKTKKIDAFLKSKEIALQATN